MGAESYTGTVTIDGEVFQYDPENSLVLFPCDNCGHLNEVDCDVAGGSVTLSGFSCENCGHWNDSR